MVGVCALCWAIWLCRNDLVFNKKKVANFLQVIHMASGFIRMWSYLQREDRRADLATGCNRLEMVARDLFNRSGWRNGLRISDA